MSTFDYIIVGAGSAGCVLANRLTEDADRRVLLLEAGGEDDSPLIKSPGTYMMLQDSAVDWAYRTVPQVHLGGRRVFSPRGRVLGGSSSINFGVYMRGNARDFDRWRDAGNPGWGYEDVLPYFKRAEDNRDIHDEWHGRGGPLTVTSPPTLHPLVQPYLESAQEAGLPLNPDFNGARQFGCGLLQRTIRDGSRCSAAEAYLRPALSRRNLTVLTHAYVTALRLKGRNTIGAVEFIRDGQVHQAHAAIEVILSGGAFNSPHLLMLSGIGPAKELERVGVKVVHDLPGLGKNLQDHVGVRIGYEINQPLSFPALPASVRQAAMDEYARSRTGPMAGNHLEAGAYATSMAGEESWPALQMFFFGFLPTPYPEAAPSAVHGMGANAYVNRPRSTGRVTLASSDPLDRPVIDPNYLADPEDLRVLMAGVRWNLKILGGSPFAKFRKCAMFPDSLAQDDDTLQAFIRERATTIWHVSGTCRMGTDNAAVVDPELRLRGLEGLRVVDASVMPHIVGANTNASVIMIAEKASDMIRKRSPLRATADAA